MLMYSAPLMIVPTIRPVGPGAALGRGYRMFADSCGDSKAGLRSICLRWINVARRPAGYP